DAHDAFMATTEEGPLPPDAWSAPSRAWTFAATARSAAGSRIRAWVVDRAAPGMLGALAKGLLIAALPIVILSVVLARWAASRPLRPLSEMAGRAAGLPVGASPRSLGPRSGLEEIDRLGASFDRLLERLDDAMSAERRLTADASHELRTPLTALSGELE